MNKAKNVIKYYILNNKLKNVIRKGWKNWNVNASRLESVAEHVYGTLSLAIAMYSEYEYELDLYKVIMMLSIHELEEIIIGDLTAWDISKEEKERMGHEAVKEILKDLLIKDELESLVLEFDKRETKEAVFAYHIDKLECDVQCKIYDQLGYVDLNNQPGNNILLNDEKVKSLLNDDKYCWSKMWINYDKDKYVDDANFLEVLDYVENNDI